MHTTRLSEHDPMQFSNYNTEYLQPDTPAMLAYMFVQNMLPCTTSSILHRVKCCAKKLSRCVYIIELVIITDLLWLYIIIVTVCINYKAGTFVYSF